MSAIERCPNGHFYDKEANEKCPYCNPEASINLDRRVRPNTDADRGYENEIEEGRIPTIPLDRDKKNGGSVIDDPSTHTVPVNGLMTNSSKITKFVTGWLVAIKGPYLGKSFEVYAGYTKIGRTQENDIVLSKDSTVSSRHASTHYSVKRNQFHLQCADTPTNSVVVDNEELLTNEKALLHPYSRIELGNSVFLFVPFCTDKYRWKELSTEA